MTDEPRQQHIDGQTRTTGIFDGAGEAWPPVPMEPEPPPYVKEPLFSKKVLAGWAIGTLMVWFTFTVIVPEIIRSVKAEIGERVLPPATGTATETVYETRRGTIRVRRDADGRITVERTRTGDATPEPLVTIPAPKADPVPPAPVPPAPSPTN